MAHSTGFMGELIGQDLTWWNRPLWGYIPEQQPWWNRPLWGHGNIINVIFGELNKEQIPDRIIFNYNQELEKITKISQELENINISQFNNQEFLLYLEIKYKLKHNLQEYQGLSDVIDLLIVGIKVKKLFIKLEQLELRYRNSKQQEIYQFVTSLLEQDLTQEEFLNQLNEKVAEILPSIVTEYSKTALRSYTEILKSISNYKLGLKLLFLFKKHGITKYSLVRSLYDIVDNLIDKEVSNVTVLLSMVNLNQELFNQLTEITGLCYEKSTPDTYTKILQYMALSYKYQNVYNDFNALKEIFKNWQEPYNNINNIRQKYNLHNYKQPKEFKAIIPGETIYKTYQMYC